MYKRSQAAVLSAAAIAPWMAASHDATAAPIARVEYSDRFTTRMPNAPSGRLFHDQFFDSRDPNAKPPAVSHVHVQLPAGARFHTDALPACGATDAQLMAQGAAACRPGSQVGTEVYSFDTGVDGPDRLVTNDITFLNDPGQLIILTRERKTGTRVVVRGKLGPDTLDFDLPPLPGTPPEGGADRREDAVYPVVTGPAGAAWLTTPPTCPASRTWTFRVDYTFHNGEKVTATSPSPCDPAPARVIPAHVTFFRHQHGRTLRLRANRATTAAIRISRHGGRPAARRTVHLNAGLNRVRLPAVPPGTYRLSVTPAGGAAREAALTIRP